MFNKDMLNKGILQKQRLMLFGIILGVMSLVGLFVWANQPTVPIASSQSVQTNIATAGQVMNPQEIWVSKMEEEDKLRDTRVDELEKLVTTLIQEKEEVLMQSASQNFRAANVEGTDFSLSQAAPGDTPVHRAAPFPALDQDLGVSLDSNPIKNHTSSESSEKEQATGIFSKKLVLTQKAVNPNQPVEKPKKTIENTIPAGAYVQALILGGVDASTSTTSQADPRPVLIRMLDEGTLPRKFKSDLKDCHVLASAHGDISSERVFMRLEKLTCTEPLTGEIIETEVAGYVAGEDGCTGVRGKVADRSGEAMRAGFVGGFFSGVSQFFGAAEQRALYPISPFGQLNAMPPQTMLSAGVSQGTGNALDRYAEFYIKRAEQLQPVIQVAAGREVTIVFTQGTTIGGSSVKETLHKIREESRKDIVNSLESKPDSKHWLPAQESY